MLDIEKQQEERAAVIHTGGGAARPYAAARLVLCFGQLSSNDSLLGLAHTKATLAFASGYATASADTLRTQIHSFALKTLPGLRLLPALAERRRQRRRRVKTETGGMKHG